MDVRIVTENYIKNAVAKLAKEAAICPPEDVRAALISAYERETNANAKQIFKDLIQNAELACKKQRPYCQDTGMAVVFIDIGNCVLIDGDLYHAVNEGISQAYRENYFRKSTLYPITREKIADNTPAVVHLRQVPGDKIKITVAPKGFGSENMSRLQMLKPSAGVEGVEDFILETVKLAGGNPCPPGIVGVGIGGTFDSVTTLAKRQLLRPIGEHNSDPRICDMEKRLLKRINALGIGPMGLGGDTTMLAINIAEAPTHIAGLPVAVNIQCHAARHATKEI